MQLVLYILKTYGPWAVVIVVVLFFVKLLLDEDRSALLRSKLYRFAYSVTGRIEQEKKFISNDIRGKLNLARRKMHFGVDILPKAIDIAWISGSAGEAHDIGEGEFVVRLDPNESQPKNISLLACTLVKRTTLGGIRHLVEEPLQTSIDLNLVRTILKDIRNAEVLDWFLSNEYQPRMTKDKRTEFRNEQITAIDERGLFTRLLLIELERFAKEIEGKPPRPYMAGEIEGLVEFLYRICTKNFGERVPLFYERAIMRIGVIIFAETTKAFGSLDPYIRAMEIHLRAEPTAIYVLAFDKEWLGEFDPERHAIFEKQIEKLGGELERSTIVEKTHSLKYSCIDQSGKRRISHLIRFVPPKA